MDNGQLLTAIRAAGQRAARRQQQEDAARRRDLAYQRTGMHLPVIVAPMTTRGVANRVASSVRRAAAAIPAHAPRHTVYAPRPSYTAPAPVYQAPAAPVYHAPVAQVAGPPPAPAPPAVPLYLRRARAAGTDVGQASDPALDLATARFMRTHAWARTADPADVRLAAAYALRQGSSFYSAPPVTAFGRNLEPAAPPRPPARRRRTPPVRGGEVG